MSKQSSFEEYLHSIIPTYREYDFKSKSTNINNMLSYQLSRTRRIFKWSGLPKTVPERMLELYLQSNGNVAWSKYKDDLYVFIGGLGGEPNAYYMPTIYTVSNPALKYSANLNIGTDCVVMSNDTNYMGLLPLLSYYCTAMCENRITMNIYDILSRIPALITTPDDRSKKSAEIFINEIVSGEYGILADNQLFDGIRSLPFSQSSGNKMVDLIEYEQYLKASMYNEIGLDANYNMKRENLNTSETEKDNNSMIPLIDDMLKCRQESITEVNEMFGTNISVDYDSVWKVFIEQMEVNSDQTENVNESNTDIEEVNNDTETANAE